MLPCSCSFCEVGNWGFLIWLFNSPKTFRLSPLNPLLIWKHISILTSRYIAILFRQTFETLLFDELAKVLHAKVAFFGQNSDCTDKTLFYWDKHQFLYIFEFIIQFLETQVSGDEVHWETDAYLEHHGLSPDILTRGRHVTATVSRKIFSPRDRVSEYSSPRDSPQGWVPEFLVPQIWVPDFLILLGPGWKNSQPRFRSRIFWCD